VQFGERFPRRSGAGGQAGGFLQRGKRRIVLAFGQIDQTEHRIRFAALRLQCERALSGLAGLRSVAGGETRLRQGDE
jgi:hypothetical protein